MTLTKRLIPCLDIIAGRVVKGINFTKLRDAGDPVEIASQYSIDGADEITFLNIDASSKNSQLIVDVVKAVASKIFIPLTVGGGVKTLEDICTLLRAGADKVCINTTAVTNPKLISDATKKYGSQCVVVAIDVKEIKKRQWQVFTHGGHIATNLDAVEWARQAVTLGAGEILLTSMDRDGTHSGFDLELTRIISQIATVPVIASGGVGTLQDLANGIKYGKADAVLAASIFHYGKYTIQEAKRFMANQDIAMRLI